MVSSYPGGYYTCHRRERKTRPQRVSSAQECRRRTGLTSTERRWTRDACDTALARCSSCSSPRGGGGRRRRLRRLGLVEVRPRSPADVEFLSPERVQRRRLRAASRWWSTTSARGAGPATEAPDLVGVRQVEHPEGGFVGVAVDDTQSDVVDFMAEYGLAYPVVLDDNSLGANDGVTGVPDDDLLRRRRPGGGPHHRRGGLDQFDPSSRQGPVSLRACAASGGRAAEPPVSATCL